MTTESPTLEPRPHQLPAGLTASQERALIRDGYACFRCGDHALEQHLRIVPRVRRVDAVANLISLCTFCLVEAAVHRRRSIRLGYLIPAGNFNPAAIPVLHHRNGWVVLTGDGKWAKADEYAVRDWEARWGV